MVPVEFLSLLPKAINPIYHQHHVQYPTVLASQNFPSSSTQNASHQQITASGGTSGGRRQCSTKHKLCCPQPFRHSCHDRDLLDMPNLHGQCHDHHQPYHINLHWRPTTWVCRCDHLCHCLPRLLHRWAQLYRRSGPNDAHYYCHLPM